MLQIAAVSPQLLTVLTQLMQMKELNAFRLVGGTALALQMGHRVSVDIDLFTDKPFNRQEIIYAITAVYEPQLISQTATGITIFINGIKVDLCNWVVPFIGELIQGEGIRMASIEDIVAFKMDAITDRKDQKDFYDLFFLLKKLTVEEAVQSYRLKYPFNNLKDVFAGIAAISQADNSPIPILTKPLEWNLIKETLTNLFGDYIHAIQALKEAEEARRQENIMLLIEKKKNKKDN